LYPLRLCGEIILKLHSPAGIGNIAPVFQPN